MLEVALLIGSAMVALATLLDGRFAALRHGACAWALAAPLLVALVHGMLPGLFTGVAVAISLHALDALPWADVLQTGNILSTLLAGFAGHLTDTRRRVRALLEERLEEQSADSERQFREQEVLRASHALLSERLSAEQWSLASSVEDALRQISAQPLEKAGNTLLSLIEAQAMVRAAALYVSSGAGLPEFPQAKLGPLTSPRSHHIALRAAFQAKRLVVPQLASGSAPRLDQDVVLVVPIVTSDGRSIGVIAIHELPFAAMHDGHFTLIATLVNGCADAMHGALRRSDSAFDGSEAAEVITLPVSVPPPLPTRLPGLPNAARKLAILSPQTGVSARPSLPPPSIDLRARIPRLPPTPRKLALSGVPVGAEPRAAPGAALDSGLRAAPTATGEGESSRQASGA